MSTETGETGGRVESYMPGENTFTPFNPGGGSKRRKRGKRNSRKSKKYMKKRYRGGAAIDGDGNGDGVRDGNGDLGGGSEEGPEELHGGRRKSKKMRNGKMKKSKARKGKVSNWITHVKNFAKSNKIDFRDALKDPKCKSSYHKMK